MDGLAPLTSRTFPEWKRGKILGRGAHGTVYLGRVEETRELVAVKSVQTDGMEPADLEAIEHEIRMIKGLSHPNIVRYLGTENRKRTLNIFLEYAPGGSLRQLLQERGSKPFDEALAARYTLQVLSGLAYLHGAGIAHRDIKGANVLLAAEGHCKLADFGASKRVEAHSIVSGLKGTPHWMAPEVIKGQQTAHGWKKADVWSIGCTVIEMLTGKSPWPMFPNPMAAMYHIASGERPPLDTGPDGGAGVSALADSFVEACCRQSPDARPEASDLLADHPFLEGARAEARAEARAGAAAHWTQPPKLATDAGRGGGGSTPRAEAKQGAEQPKLLRGASAGEFNWAAEPDTACLLAERAAAALSPADAAGGGAAEDEATTLATGHRPLARAPVVTPIMKHVSHAFSPPPLRIDTHGYPHTTAPDGPSPSFTPVFSPVGDRHRQMTFDSPDGGFTSGPGGAAPAAAGARAGLSRARRGGRGRSGTGGSGRSDASSGESELSYGHASPLRSGLASPKSRAAAAALAAAEAALSASPLGLSPLGLDAPRRAAHLAAPASRILVHAASAAALVSGASGDRKGHVNDRGLREALPAPGRVAGAAGAALPVESGDGRPRGAGRGRRSGLQVAPDGADGGLRVMATVHSGDEHVRDARVTSGEAHDAAAAGIALGVSPSGQPWGKPSVQPPSSRTRHLRDRGENGGNGGAEERPVTPNRARGEGRRERRRAEAQQQQQYQSQTPSLKGPRLFAPERTQTTLEFTQQHQGGQQVAHQGGGGGGDDCDEFGRPKGAASGQLRKLDFLHSLERASTKGAAAVRLGALNDIAHLGGQDHLRCSKSAGVPNFNLPPLLHGMPLGHGGGGGGGGGTSYGVRAPLLPLRHIASAPSAVHASLHLPSLGKNPALAEPLRSSYPARLPPP